MSRQRLRKALAKKSLSKPKGKLERIDLSTAECVPSWMTRAYKNNHYVVMIDDNCKMTHGVTAIKAMVQRHDDRPLTRHWREMQDIKNEIFGETATAIEYYPAENQLLDYKNIYWMFVFPDDELIICDRGIA